MRFIIKILDYSPLILGLIILGYVIYAMVKI